MGVSSEGSQEAGLDGDPAIGGAGGEAAVDPVAAIDQNCVGCGNCGEVAEAAVLCPSFYRATLVSNPTAWDRWSARLRGAVIGWLQRRRESARLRPRFGEHA